MTFALGLLAAALLGGGADGPTTPATTAIRYEIKVIDMEGLAWRSALHPKLHQVARQGNATVWAAPGEAVATLVKKSRRVVMAPQVTAPPQAPAHFSQYERRKFIAEMARIADGPVNHASYVAFHPKVADAREGVSATVTGRKIDQGVLACLAIDDREIAAVHAVSLPEVLEKSTCPDCDNPGKDQAGVQIQVPETSHCEVTGEWLIPDGGALVVSFGVHTAADPNGWAVVRERLAVIEAKAVEGKMEMKAAYQPALAPELASHIPGLLGRGFHVDIISPSVISYTPSRPEHYIVNPLPLPPSMAMQPTPTPSFTPNAKAIPMPVPAPPTRWRPAEGMAIEPPLALPPLPVESSLPSASAAPMPVAPLPTPPPRVSSAKTKVDSASVKASAVDSMFSSVLAAVLPAKSTAKSGWIPLGGGKTFEVNLPVLGNVEFNVQAYARPKPAEPKKTPSNEPD